MFRKDESVTHLKKVYFGFSLFGLLIGCQQSIQIRRELFQKQVDGKDVDLFTLKNSNGVKVQITNYGGKIVSIIVPDSQGNMRDVVLGYDSIDEYVNGNPSFGATIGRYANRIAKGKFSINGQEYTLATNNGLNHLHGGIKGFRYKVWDVVDQNDKLLRIKYLSKDMEEGYPGNLEIFVTFTLLDTDSLQIVYEAKTDKPTVVNLTNHSFFNLTGEGIGNILGNYLLINADSFTPVDETLIPTGEIRSLNDSPFDFRELTRIGDRINHDDRQLKFGNGYDHNYVLKKDGIGRLTFAARLIDPKSGRIMEVYTTEPSLQFYSGNFLNGRDIGKDGKVYGFRTALCLETQHYPDSPNHLNFPTTLLNPGQTFQSTTIYKFSVQ